MYAPWGYTNPPIRPLELQSTGSKYFDIACTKANGNYGYYTIFLYEDDNGNGVLDPEDGYLDHCDIDVDE
jgi:hypothetical protein